MGFNNFMKRHGLHNLEKSLNNFSNHLEQSLISLLGLEKSLKFRPSFTFLINEMIVLSRTSKN